MLIILNISSHLKPLYDVNTKEFIPAITVGTNYWKHVRKLISLPTKLGSIGILFFYSEIADREYQFSQILSTDLALKIINQDRQHQPNDNASKVKDKIKLNVQQHHQNDLSTVKLM